MLKIHKLASYMFENGLRQDYVAKTLGITRQCLWRYCNGEWPNPKIAKKIEAFTDGKVTAKDMLAGRPKPKVCECCGRRWQKKDTRKQPELF